jgi:hypothetical protein
VSVCRVCDWTGGDGSSHARCVLSANGTEKQMAFRAAAARGGFTKAERDALQENGARREEAGRLRVSVAKPTLA